jgi:hypothetical protein
VFTGRINIVMPRFSRVYAGDEAKMQLQAGMARSNIDFI